MIIPLRKSDTWGQGHYQAPRGQRKHNGVDIAYAPDVEVQAYVEGKVTKIGFPYDPGHPKKGHCRYVQITTADGFDVRYFYLDPLCSVGLFVRRGECLGKVQDMTEIYPGITSHFHIEVKDPEGEFIDPIEYLADQELKYYKKLLE